MTEKEKCRQGLLYDANYDAELLSDREKAKEQLYDYNRLRPSQQEEKTQLLKSFLGKTGNNLIIEPPFACDYGYNIEVGENFYANVNLVILDGLRSVSVTMLLSPRTLVSILPVIRWMQSSETVVLNMPVP